jgi:hypothetical protein
MPFFPRILVQLVGLGVLIGQRRVIGVGQGAGLDLMPQSEQMLAADPDLAGELGGGHSLGDAAEDQEDLSGAQMGPLPGGVSEHVEDPATTPATVIDDRGVGATAMDVEALAGSAAGAGMALGMEQVEELLTAALLVHQVDDREVHEVGSRKMKSGKSPAQKTRSARG